MLIERLLRKRTIFFLLFSLSIVLSTTTALLGRDYMWWLKGSIFFSITTIIGIYVGQLTTAYKVRHALATKVDDLVNELAIPKLTTLHNLALETSSFLQFGEDLLALLCEDFDYEGGVIYIFEKSLKPTFKQTYYHHSKQGVALTQYDYQLYDEICGRAPNCTSILSSKSKFIYSIKCKNKPEHNREEKLDENYYTSQFNHLKLLPISLAEEYLGYIGLFRKTKPSVLDDIFDIVRILSEKTILQDIENKKIDDSVKNFLFRQLILQVILTIRELDNIHDDLQSMKSFDELGEKIIEVVRDHWNFNACVIKHKDKRIVERADSSVDMQIIKNKLLTRIDQRIRKENETQIYEEKAAQICQADEKPGFVGASAIKIHKGRQYFGYLLVTANRELTTFEKQVLVILENYKIDDCYQELSLKLKEITKNKASTIDK